MAVDKDIQKIIRHACRKQGWQQHQRRGHIILTPPDCTKPKVVVSVTPSCPRAFQNFRHDMRHSGYRETP